MISQIREKDKESLAIFGAPPIFKEKLHVGRPNIGNKQKFRERLDDILDSNWLTNNGPYVQELEKQIAELAGVKHCIAICNATTALEIVIRALGLTGEVIIPSLTFVATAHALQWQEITPVFCDVDPTTLCMDPDIVERMITPKTSAIIGVHLFGRPCNVDKLEKIAKRNNLKLLYDASHAFCCSTGGRMIGSFGDAEVFSFHATKFLNSFEGGAIVTNNEVLAKKIRLMKNFGFSGHKNDSVIYIGINGKMSEVSAAMGLTSLESLDEIVERNRQNYHCYKKDLADVPGITLLSYNESEKNNYHYIVLTVDQSRTGISRDELLKVLEAENILARRYFYPGCHRMEPYRSLFPHAGLLLPVTEEVGSQLLSLPSGMSIGRDEISTICEVIRCAVSNNRKICARLRECRNITFTDGKE